MMDYPDQAPLTTDMPETPYVPKHVEISPVYVEVGSPEVTAGGAATQPSTEAGIATPMEAAPTVMPVHDNPFEGYEAEIRNWWVEITHRPDLPSPHQQHPFVYLETRIEELIRDLVERLKKL